MTTDDLAKAIATSEMMLKSHVKQHTRKTASGAVIQVKEHDDSRSKHPHPFHAHADKLAASAKKEHREYEDNNEAWHVAGDMKEAAKNMKEKDHAGLKATLANAYDNYTKEKIIEHIHPDHWEGLGIEAIDKKRSVKKFEASHGPEAKHDINRTPSHRLGRKLLAENAAQAVGGMGQHDDGSGVSTALAPHSPGDEEKHVAAFKEHLESNGFKPRKDVVETDSKEGDLHYKHPNGAKASILTRNWLGAKKSKQKRVSLEIHSGVKDDKGTPWDKTEKSQLETAITHSETLLKAHVKASQRKTASGAIVQVKEHEDGRQAAAASQAANKHHSSMDFDSHDDMKRAAKLHTDAAMKHIQAFHSGRGAGDEEAQNHYYKASAHLGSAHSNRTFLKGHEVEAAKEASKSAETLSKVANKHQVEHTAASLDVGASTHLLAMEQHQRASQAHMKAANANYGDTGARAEHEKQAQKHDAIASEHGKKVQEIAGVTIKASAKARTLGEHAKTTEEHVAASQAHSEAAKLNYDSEGRADHEKMAKFHAGKAGKAEKPGEKKENGPAKTDADHKKALAVLVAVTTHAGKSPEEQGTAIGTAMAELVKRGYDLEKIKKLWKENKDKLFGGGAVAEAKAATSSAKKATKAAKESGSAADHQKAAEAHKAASKANLDARQEGGAEHFGQAHAHLLQARKHETAAEAGGGKKDKASTAGSKRDSEK